MTIHDTPKRSATIPKRGEKKVLVSGICTCPPSASALNRRSASASLGTVSDSDIPWKPGLPWQAPSDAITVVSPMRRLACMILFSEPGATITGRRRLGAFLETHQHSGLGAKRLPVELDRLFAASVKRQI